MSLESDHHPRRAPGFIGFAGEDWWYHNRAHSDFQLLTRLARDHSVLLVNSIGMRLPLPGRTSRPLHRIARKLRSVLRALRRPVPDLPRLWVFSPLPLPLYGSALGRRVAAAFVRAQVRMAAKWAGISDPVIFLTPPTAWPVARAMKGRLFVYNRADKHSLFREADQAYLRELEHDLLARADLVLYASQALMQDEAEQTRGRAHHLDHGVDVRLFDPARAGQEPADLAPIPRPRVGFFGGLRSFLVDFGLLAQLARSLPDAQIVLIGDAPDATDELERIPNLHLLGFKDSEAIPAYGARFDVALMPYRSNEWIRFCNPIKLKEYLALGLRVVATDFPEAHRYEPYVAVAGGVEDFVAKVREALASHATEAERLDRRARVLETTWDRQTAAFVGLVDEILASEQGARSVE